MAKPKKKHRALKAFLIVVLSFVFIAGALVGAVYGCFYDGGRSDFVPGETTNITEVVSNMVVDSLDDTKDTKKLRFQIQEHDLNQIMYDAYKNTKLNNEYIKGITLDIVGNNYNFYLDAAVPLFKTRLQLQTTLDQQIIDGKNAFVFTIKDIKIGRIGGLFDLALKLFGNFLNDEVISNLLSQTGLSINCDIKNKRLYYGEDDVLNDVLKIIGDGEENGLYGEILTDAFFRRFISFEFSDGSLDTVVDLTKLEHSNNYTTPEKELNINIANYKSKITTLLNNKTLSRENIKQAFDFLLRGYDETSEEGKNWANSKDLSSIGITDCTSYLGESFKAGNNFESIITSQISLESLASGHIATISENDLNSLIRTFNIIGYSFFLTREVSPNEYKVNNITISDLYCNIVDDHIYFVLKIDVNGHETTFAILSKTTANEAGKIAFNIEEVYFGEDKATPTLAKYFIALLANSTMNTSWIKFDTNANSINIDYGEAISASPFSSYIVGAISTSITGASLDAEGGISLDFSLS